jgi:hypothetical protein
VARLRQLEHTGRGGRRDRSAAFDDDAAHVR